MFSLQKYSKRFSPLTLPRLCKGSKIKCSNCKLVIIHLKSSNKSIQKNYYAKQSLCFINAIFLECDCWSVQLQGSYIKFQFYGFHVRKKKGVYKLFHIEVSAASAPPPELPTNRYHLFQRQLALFENFLQQRSSNVTSYPVS